MLTITEREYRPRKERSFFNEKRDSVAEFLRPDTAIEQNKKIL